MLVQRGKKLAMTVVVGVLGGVKLVACEIFHKLFYAPNRKGPGRGAGCCKDRPNWQSEKRDFFRFDEQIFAKIQNWAGFF